MRPLLLLVVALLAAAPAIALPAAAQMFPLPLAGQTTVLLQVAPPESPLDPSGNITVIPMLVEYTFFSAAPSLSSTPVHLKVTNLPSWASVTVSPSTVYIPASSPCLCQQTVTEQALLLAQVTPDAPAFTAGTVEVQGTAEPNDFRDASEGKTSFPIQAGFYSVLGAAGPGGVALAAGKQVALPVQVTNFGNAPVRVTSHVVSAPSGVDVASPSPIALQSRQQGGHDVTKTAQWVLTGEPGSKEGDLVLELEATYLLDGRVEGDRVQYVAHVARAAGDGSGVSVQGLLSTDGSSLPLQMGMVAVAVAGIALEWRRRHAPR